jgi:hypothetical protein
MKGPRHRQAGAGLLLGQACRHRGAQLDLLGEEMPQEGLGAATTEAVIGASSGASEVPK